MNRRTVGDQSPGSNAVDVTHRVRVAMGTLATRFPADLTHAVFFDTTVFVTATIEEVIRTRQYSTLRAAGRLFDQLERQLAAKS